MRRSKKTSSNRESAEQGHIEKQLQGAQSDARGARYELRVVSYFSNKGWKPQTRVHYSGYEYDIFANRWDFLRGDQYLVVECKHTKIVTTHDIAHFIAKVDALCRGLPDLESSTSRLYAYLCHSGEIAQEAATVARGHRPPIELVKIQ